MIEKRKIDLAAYDVTILENEKILYSETLRKIVILNSTAAFIWDKLCEVEKEDKVVDINEIEIGIWQKFDTSIFCVNTIKDDIELTINRFSELGFLTFK